MIVCHCLVVNDAAVVEAVEAGATTLAKVCQTTGAGTDCGSCVFAVKALLCQHDVSRTPLGPEVAVAAGEPARGGDGHLRADADVWSLNGARSAVSHA